MNINDYYKTSKVIIPSNSGKSSEFDYRYLNGCFYTATHPLYFTLYSLLVSIHSIISLHIHRLYTHLSRITRKCKLRFINDLIEVSHVCCSRLRLLGSDWWLQFLNRLIRNSRFPQATALYNGYIYYPHTHRWTILRLRHETPIGGYLV